MSDRTVGPIGVQGSFRIRKSVFKGRAAATRAVAVAFLSAVVVGFELVRPIHAADPAVRAGIETTITLGALLSAVLLFGHFKHTRRLRDLLLLGALATVSLTDLVFSALPALAEVHTVASGNGARLGCTALVAIAFAAAALAPRVSVAGGIRRMVAFAAIAGIGTVALAELVDLSTGAGSAPAALHQSGIAAAGHDPVALTVAISASAVLVFSGIAFVRRGGGEDTEVWLLAGASFLLAAARLQYLAMPAVAADWVTPGEGLRLAAYALLLAAALRQYSKTPRDAALAAVSAERRRIARDLHDGLAQDLAFIGAHAEQLNSELGPEHPLTIAAGRALAASRGAIVDLSASAAPTTGAALRQVADELEARFAVQVNVRIEAEPALAGSGDLSPSDREQVVRIAREAIVNAVRHGGARHVDVVLDWRGTRRLLRVADDGCGIADAALHSRSGFGLPTMRARAESLGGRLLARRRARGGTELEVLVVAPTAEKGYA